MRRGKVWLQWYENYLEGNDELDLGLEGKVGCGAWEYLP